MNRLVKQGFLRGGDATDTKGAGSHRGARIGAEGATDGWALAVGLTERWLATGERVDVLLEQLRSGLAPPDRARAQHFFFGVVRWHGRLEAGLDGLMARPPRTLVRAGLLVAGVELLEAVTKPEKEDSGAVAKIIHHAVERMKTLASPKEAGLVNAVARKLAARLVVAPGTLAGEFSHPEWLVRRWSRDLGDEGTRALLVWNQSPAPVHVRWRAPAGAETPAPPDFLAPTRWPGFFEVRAGHWDEVRRLVAEGALYIQDPSTRLAVELLDPQPGEKLLDACAAPGGKCVHLADVMKSGRIVALDLPPAPGEPATRLERLKENLNRVPRGVEVALMPADVRRAGPRFFKEYNLPEAYDAVLLDVPCSNTGVMRHRVDVKWRLQEGDFAKHAGQQLVLLRAAARLVRAGGRLVYSTCSVDAEENEQVVRRFLHDTPGWSLEKSVLAYPWIDEHDGAGAFRLRRK